MIADSVAARLRAEGFEVEIARDGPGGVELCRRLRPHLVVLDLMLPGFDGLEVCRRIQTDRPVSVLMLTARDSETDMVVGLGIGADDYMTKPFSQRELVARVHTLLRRIERDQSHSPSTSDRISLGALDIDRASRRATLADREIELTPKEFDLLVHLAQRPGVVFSRGQLLTEVWGYADSTGERTVDSHIAGLRKKLGPERVRTVRGSGYAFEQGPAP